MPTLTLNLTLTADAPDAYTAEDLIRRTLAMLGGAAANGHPPPAALPPPDPPPPTPPTAEASVPNAHGRATQDLPPTDNPRQLAELLAHNPTRWRRLPLSDKQTLIRYHVHHQTAGDDGAPRRLSQSEWNKHKPPWMPVAAHAAALMNESWDALSQAALAACRTAPSTPPTESSSTPAS